MQTNKPVIFLGSNMCLERLKENCQDLEITVHGVIDTDYYGNADHLDGIPVIGDEDYLRDNVDQLKKDFVFFLAVNWLPMSDSVSERNRQKRQHWIKVIQELELDCISIVSKHCHLYRSAKIGKNVFIGDFTVVEPRVTLGDFVTLWDQVIIGHDSQIDQNSVVQRGVTLHSSVSVGQDVFLSPFSRVCARVTVRDGSWVNPGVLMFRDTEHGEVVRMDRSNTRRLHAYLDQSAPDHLINE